MGTSLVLRVVLGVVLRCCCCCCWVVGVCVQRLEYMHSAVDLELVIWNCNVYLVIQMIIHTVSVKDVKRVDGHWRHVGSGGAALPTDFHGAKLSRTLRNTKLIFLITEKASACLVPVGVSKEGWDSRA